MFTSSSPLLRFAVLILLPSLCLCQNIVVETPQTAFLGTSSPLYPASIHQYLGVQYAVAPRDALRFRPPQPFRTNTAITTATNYRSDCIQFPTTNRMSENCLHLNIYKPANASFNNVKPVVLFVHGGGYNNGAARHFPGDDLVAVGDIVYVAANYRLGALGFLAHPALDAEDPGNPTSGNYGLLDVIEALRWLQRYIRYFGGDPSNVTIMGSSAGSISIGFLLATPEASGLFDKAILISYSALQGTSRPALGPLYWNTQKQRSISDATVNYLNCSSFIPAQVRACLRDEFLFGSRFAQFSDSSRWPEFYQPQELLDHHVWGPIADGFVVPDDPLTLFQRGQYLNIPVLAGTNSDEATSFVGNDFLRDASDEDAEERIRRDFPEISTEVADFYSQTVPDEQPGFRYAQVKTDQYLHCPIRRLFLQMLEDNPNQQLFSYRFNEVSSWRTDDDDLLRRVAHGSISPYIFGQQSNNGVMLLGSPAEQRLHFDVMSYWTNFIKTGDPGFDSRGIVQFPRFDESEQTVALETPLPRVENDYKKNVCEFWDGHTPRPE